MIAPTNYRPRWHGYLSSATSVPLDRTALLRAVLADLDTAKREIAELRKQVKDLSYMVAA